MSNEQYLTIDDPAGLLRNQYVWDISYLLKTLTNPEFSSTTKSLTIYIKGTALTSRDMRKVATSMDQDQL